MAVDNSKLRVSELDFDTIKENFKTFLRAQSQFKDYNFEGSSISIILDLLAYNTHYNAVMANMLANEMFLDSATKRSSVISKAKELNYVPFSAKCPTILVDLEYSVPNSDTSRSMTLQKGYSFNTVIDSKNYTFLIRESVSAARVNDTYTFRNVKLYEGSLKQFSYTVNNSLNEPFYTIPDTNVDLSTLRVLTYTSSEDLTIKNYKFYSDITELNSTTNAYFLQMNKDGLYEVYFGDGVLGSKPVTNNIIVLEYISTNMMAANGAKVFRANDGSNPKITNVAGAVADGGAFPESTYSIKFNAPKAYTSQNRAVTANDYKYMIPKLFPIIRSINVWGGEENDPPVYGKVFISIEPNSGEVLSREIKNTIIDELMHRKNVVTVIPEIVDPDYLYIGVNSTIYYNSLNTERNAYSYRTMIKDIIINYNNLNLSKFDGVFRYSQLSKDIDSSDNAIVSNITKVNMHKFIVPNYNVQTKYIINFYNPIYKNEFGTPEKTIYTPKPFRIVGDTTDYYLEDDGNYYMNMFYYDNSKNKIYVQKFVGTVDYAKGIVELILNISSIEKVNFLDSGFKLIATPSSNDVIPSSNLIIKINEQDIVVDAIIDKISSNISSSTNDYIFTSSH